MLQNVRSIRPHPSKQKEARQRRHTVAHALRRGEGIPDGAFSAPTDDPVGAPAAPTWGTATGGVGVATLDWNDNGEADLSGYTLKRSTTSGGPYTDVNVSLLGNSNYTDSGLAADTYYYVVSATDTSNQESSNSSEVSAVVTASGGTGTTAPSSISVTDGH